MLSAGYTGISTTLTDVTPPFSVRLSLSTSRAGGVSLAKAVARFGKRSPQLRARWPKLATLMDESEADVLAYMSFPAQHRTKLHSTNPLERLNKEVKRRADAVGIFPNEDSIVRLIGAVLFEQNDEWQSQHRYMQVEAFAQIDADESDLLLSITTQAA